MIAGSQKARLWPAPGYELVTARPAPRSLKDRSGGITPFEGNYYVRRKYLLTSGFKVNFIPGFCLYKFLYVWLDLRLSGAQRVRNLGWLYWLPNPLFPFIWCRVAVPKHHPELLVSKVEKAVNG